MITFNIKIKATGPVYDGRWKSSMRELMKDVRTEIGFQALANVRHICDVSFKRPTPYYETQIISQSQGDKTIVHDRGIVYGPWLEGVSHRNVVTRFKGYAMFRKGMQQVEDQFERVVAPAVERFIRKVG
jgi:hypothetical protein